jgi:activating signal cointegrator 1
MRAISLWQPWATFVALGLKQFETRSWDTAYRGPLLIHAAKRPMTKEEYKLIEYLKAEYSELCACLNGAEFPLGALVASCEVVDCLESWKDFDPLEADPLEYDLGNYDEGRFAWKLDNVEPLKEPIPYKGSQGFFNVWDSVLIYQRKKDVNA